jgi:8-oxo-dGTP diphosphatase
MKTVRKSVAFVVYNKDRTKFLAVQRPYDDENLPNVWGLPAGSLKGEETFEDAVLRAGVEKLGVKLRIEKLVGEGEIDRKSYTLFMREYEVKVIDGEPKVPQPVEGITQYQNLRWAIPSEIVEAAQKGSLCSRLYLRSIHYNW